jgi:DNA-binding transcriptional MocR family regulator
MSMSNLAYARCAYKSFSHSARHIIQLIAGHQSLQTGWAYLSYLCLSEESGLTRRRVIQLVAMLEARGVLEVRRGHGRGHVNFYRILREEDGLPIPHRASKKVKSATLPPEEKVKFPTPPEPEKVKSESSNILESLQNTAHKVVDTKERKDKAEMPVGQVPEQGEVKDEWLTPEKAVKLGLTPGSRLYRKAIGALLPGE